MLDFSRLETNKIWEQRLSVKAHCPKTDGNWPMNIDSLFFYYMILDCSYIILPDLCRVGFFAPDRCGTDTGYYIYTDLYPDSGGFIFAEFCFKTLINATGRDIMLNRLGFLVTAVPFRQVHMNGFAMSKNTVKRRLDSTGLFTDPCKTNHSYPGKQYENPIGTFQGAEPKIVRRSFGTLNPNSISFEAWSMLYLPSKKHYNRRKSWQGNIL